MTEFETKVIDVVRSIPSGATMTYLEIAKAVGSPSASRSVGNAMKKFSNDPTIPTHRVIKASGKLGAFTPGGAEEKRRLLVAEGAI